MRAFFYLEQKVAERPEKILCMTIEEIIRMLDNPATLGDALIEAAKLPFWGDHKVMFQQKRQKYISGLSDYERPIWVGEMKNLLLLCESEHPRSEENAGIPIRKESSSVLKTDVFVSYSRKDLNRVEPIVRELQKQGWSVFWDLEIPPGETWRSYIKKRLDESRCVLVVWSLSSINSDWVIAEADEAKKRGILVPVLLDAVERPFGLNHIQAADLSDWSANVPHSKFRQCVQSIKSKISLSAISLDSDRADVSPVQLLIQERTDNLNFVHIRGGLFMMGSSENEVDRSSDETQHQVKVSDFYICKYAVTVAEFRKFVEESGGYRTDAVNGDGSYVWDGKNWEKRAGINWRYGVSGIECEADEYNHPVLHVSWNDAVAYCKLISAKTGKWYRLPTEAEWEYACRAGTTTPFSTGENLTTSQANYNVNYPYNQNRKGQYRENTVTVSTLAPNGWGLYNMHGNV